MKNLINFQLSIPQKELSSIVTSAIDGAIGEESISMDSFEVKLSRIGNIDFIPVQKNIRLELPYDVNLVKKAGLFSIDAKGAVKLVIDIAYDISNDLLLTTKTTLTNYSWISKPKIDLGIVNIPIEKILQMIIERYKPIITDKIDIKLSEFSNIRKPIGVLDTSISSQIANIDLQGIHPNIALKSINLIPIVLDDDGNLHLKGSAEPNIYVNDISTYSNIKDVKLNWIERVDDSNVFKTSASLSYSFLVDSIIKNLPEIEIGGKSLDISDLKILNKQGRLYVSAKTTEPIKADILMNAIPNYNYDDKAIALNDIKIEVKPSNIIYKVTAPIVNSFIKNKLMSLFPLSTERLIIEKIIPLIPSQIPYPLGVFNVMYNDVIIDDIKFEENRIDVEVVISNLFLSTFIDNEKN